MRLRLQWPTDKPGQKASTIVREHKLGFHGKKGSLKVTINPVSKTAIKMKGVERKLPSDVF